MAVRQVLAHRTRVPQCAFAHRTRVPQVRLDQSVEERFVIGVPKAKKRGAVFPRTKSGET